MGFSGNISTTGIPKEPNGFWGEIDFYYYTPSGSTLVDSFSGDCSNGSFSLSLLARMRCLDEDSKLR
jgi:hypothetical protein